jgi:hypothetical protein
MNGGAIFWPRRGQLKVICAVHNYLQRQDQTNMLGGDGDSGDWASASFFRETGRLSTYATGLI